MFAGPQVSPQPQPQQASPRQETAKVIEFFEEQSDQSLSFDDASSPAMLLMVPAQHTAPTAGGQRHSLFLSDGQKWSAGFRHVERSDICLSWYLNAFSVQPA